MPIGRDCPLRTNEKVVVYCAYMQQTIAIRHLAFDDLGLIDPILRSRGYDIVYQDSWNLDRERVEGADLVVFLGGPISVNDTAEYPFLAQEVSLAS